MLELYFLIIAILCAIILIYYYDGDKANITKDITKESFEAQYSLLSCPFGYKSLYDKRGDMICCDGDLINNSCIGGNQCSLTNSTSDIPNCVDFILKDYEAKGKSQCPASLPSYYEDRNTKMKGCTTGILNTTMTGPHNNTTPICKIYETLEENVKGVDSCYNRKHLDEYPCFGNNCKKEVVSPIKDGPVLISVSFTDSDGMNHVGYTRQTVETYLDAFNPNWRQQGFDTSKNINVAEVAKAFYVDRTMSEKDIQLR